MATTGDFRNGLCLEFNNDLYTIVQFQHVKPGKGPAFVQNQIEEPHHRQGDREYLYAGVKINDCQG